MYCICTGLGFCRLFSFAFCADLLLTFIAGSHYGLARTRTTCFILRIILLNKQAFHMSFAVRGFSEPYLSLGIVLIKRTILQTP